MIFDTITYAGYDEMGYSSELHSNYIQLGRSWVSEANLDLEEIEVESDDKQWRMIWRKCNYSLSSWSIGERSSLF
ncbi:hypothetical protein GYMC10_1079 [Paenibacillus sp. Y412MC10]|nr:hypothetical protein GYMC10_1079 [Paenibacillus sp. Y412MC10]